MHKKKPIALKIILMAIVIAIPIKILIHMITDMDLKKRESSRLVANEGTYHLAEKNGKFIELTSEGDVYEHDFKGNAKCIEQDTNIIFLEESTDYDDNTSQLIIRKNGDIYVSSNHDYKGEKIGTVTGAISGTLSKYHIAVLTDKGDLYMYGTNEYKGLGIKGIANLDEFTKVENIPKVRKVVCAYNYTFFITTEGEVYGCGRVRENTYDTFVKFDVPNEVKDIDCFVQTIMVMDKSGNIYELGTDIYNTITFKSYISFTKLMEIGNMNSFAEGAEIFVTLDKNQKISYWGCKQEGKSVRIPISGVIEKTGNINGIFCRGRYIYVLTNQKVVRYHLKG